jgi:hypothetical protein
VLKLGSLFCGTNVYHVAIKIKNLFEMILISFSFLFLPFNYVRVNYAHLPIASTLVENINNSGNYVLPSSGILHPKNSCKSLENIVFFSHLDYL